MAKPATNVPNERSVDDVIAALDDEQTAADSRVLVEITRYAELLEDLGTHTTSRVCLYLTRLSDIQVPVLEEILRQS